MKKLNNICPIIGKNFTLSMSTIAGKTKNVDMISPTNPAAKIEGKRSKEIWPFLRANTDNIILVIICDTKYTRTKILRLYSFIKKTG